MVFHLKNSVGTGIGIGSNDNTIINNFITESEFDGVVIFGNARSVIKGNTIVKAGGFGISIDGFSDDNQILDNTIISSKDDGIFLNGKRVVIQGNTINRSGGNGIQVDSFTDFISKGVIIKDNSITNSGEFGIAILDESLNTVVIGNTLAGNGNNDMIVDNGDDTVFADNVFGN